MLSAPRRCARVLSRAAWCAGFTLVGFFPSVAAAHIELTEPIARYEVRGETGIKGCPCGMATGGGGSNRTCNVEKDGSDPNRDESRAFTAEAGSTIVLKFKETVGHGGRYRVAFDPDGADFADFNANVLTEIDDPFGSTGNVGGNNWEIEVPLPQTPCTNCTLQLIQVMEGSTLGGTVDGTKLASMSTYYACIDLVLTGEADSTAGAGSETVEVSTGDVGSFDSTEAAITSADTTPTTDVAPTAPPVTPPTPITPTALPTPPPTPITPTPVPNATDTPDPTPAPTAPIGGTTDPAAAPTGTSSSGSGCSVHSTSASSPSAALVWLALALGLGWRRRTG